MLISFSLENWMSFRDEVKFSMVATRERQHGDRVPKVGKYPARVLPVAAMYGANASGKTSFFKALKFVRELVVDDTKASETIPVEPFLLDAKMSDKPSRFSFELLIDDMVYEFSLATTREKILEEKLVQVFKGKEDLLYHRKDGNLRLGIGASSVEKEFFPVVFRVTRDNQLFLTHSFPLNVEKFQPISDWFRNSLRLLSPDSEHRRFRDEKSLLSVMSEVLSQFDTGIARLDSEGASPLDIRPDGRFSKTSKGGLKKLVTYHPKAGGGEVKFNFHQESAGTQRIIDLLPEFLNLSEQDSKKVYVIDEVDRSLHPLLTRKLLDAYLVHCSAETRAQLIFTTHDLSFMEQELLRRDEMWVAEKDADGASRLFSIGEYEGFRYDKDVRKHYLQGRFGGIPQIFEDDALTNASFNKKNKRED